jgi:hypothetical protein
VGDDPPRLLGGVEKADGILLLRGRRTEEGFLEGVAVPSEGLDEVILLDTSRGMDDGEGVFC